MTSVAFYNLFLSPEDKVLPRLLEKMLASNLRVVVVLSSTDHVQRFNKILWTFSTMAFIPHGCMQDAHDIKDEVPIWITDHVENPNQSSICVVCDDRVIVDLDVFHFSKVLYFSDGTLATAHTTLKERQAYHEKKSYDQMIYNQTENGWIKAAS